MSKIKDAASEAAAKTNKTADENTRGEVTTEMRGNGTKKRNVVIATNQLQTNGDGETDGKAATMTNGGFVIVKWEGTSGRRNSRQAL